VIHEPDLLILDEPFSGLDPVNMRLLRDLVLEQHARGATIIFSTHVMHQAEQICENVVMINHGDKVLDDSLAEIRSKYDPRTILFEPLDPNADIAPLRKLPVVQEVTRANGAYEVSLEEGVEPSGAMSAMLSALPAARVELNRPTLEDVFIRIVTGGADNGTQDLEALRASVRDDATVGGPA
jgi:ABC-2 type transport system ATP-binding protein